MDIGNRAEQLDSIFDAVVSVYENHDLSSGNDKPLEPMEGETGEQLAAIAAQVQEYTERSGQVTHRVINLMLEIQRSVADFATNVKDITRNATPAAGDFTADRAAAQDIVNSVETVRSQIQLITEAALEMKSSSATLARAMHSLNIG